MLHLLLRSIVIFILTTLLSTVRLPSSRRRTSKSSPLTVLPIFLMHNLTESSTCHSFLSWNIIHYSVFNNFVRLEGGRSNTTGTRIYYTFLEFFFVCFKRNSSELDFFFIKFCILGFSQSPFNVTIKNTVC